MSGWHVCLACQWTPVPRYRAFCKFCFPYIPWELRADVMNTYRCRVRDRRAYEEKYIELRQWWNHLRGRAGSG